MTLKNQIKSKILDFRLANHTEICHELGQRLRIHRLAKNLKQQDLADRTGVSVGTIKNLESKGQSSLETLVRIISALDLAQELDHLFELRAQSIAQMEKIEKLSLENIRRRAR